MRCNAKHEIRVGLIVASIREFRRGGKIHHRVAVYRLFRDGNVWTKSSRFDATDIPALRFALDEAQAWIVETKHETDEGGRG